MRTRLRASWVCLLAAGGMAGTPAARADERGAAAPLLPAYVQECGSCHIAFAPRLLPIASWQRLTSQLSQHFGTDASPDAASLEPIRAWLKAQSAQGRGAAGPPPPEDRITRSPWFLREHRQIDASYWRRPEVKSAVNCGACHTQAANGRFGEREIRLPR